MKQILDHRTDKMIKIDHEKNQKDEAKLFQSHFHILHWVWQNREQHFWAIKWWNGNEIEYAEENIGHDNGREKNAQVTQRKNLQQQSKNKSQ